jgi:UDP-4-amino-4,6-dideoxy-N-acetyl-beta-L-altrosamine transaminase
MQPFLPYGRQSIDEDDILAVTEVLRGDWLTTGPAVDAFEADFAAATGATHAISCANGTAALHLAALALCLGPGDRVVVPAITFLATANAAIYVGADVVFADVDADTGLMTADSLADALRRAGGPVKAIIPVHMAGQVVDLEGLKPAAERSGAALVEDASHAVGALDRLGRPIGGCAVGCMATFSLHPVKTIACGEGGVVTTNDAVLAERLRRLRSHGMTRSGFNVPEQARAADGSVNPWYYEMPEPGFNYRLSDIHAALGRSQLAKLRTFVAKRSELMQHYDRLLEPLAPVIRPIARVPGTPAWHLNAVRINFDALDMDRAAVMNRLRARGIGTQVHYLPLHRQPYFRERYGAMDLPGADRWYRRTLSLPLFPAMTRQDVERVVEALHEIVAGRQLASAQSS